MPYITFSRKFGSGPARRLLKSISRRESLVELRGSKTAKRIAEIAWSNGFSDALIINSSDSRSYTATGMSISMSANGVRFKYTRAKKIAL